MIKRDNTMIDPKIKEFLSKFHHIVDGIYVVDGDYNIEFMNKTMIERFGDGVGKKCYQVIPGFDSVCKWCKAEEVFSGKEIQWEHYIKRHNTTYELFEFPLENPDGTKSKVSIFRDITRRREAEERIRTSEEDYRRLFENVRHGLYVSTKEGKFLNANRALLDMLGYDNKEEFLKMDITKDLYLQPEDRRRFQEMIERDGYVIDYEVILKKKDGTPIPVLLTSHVLYDQNGQVLGYEGIIVDETHRKQMEQRLKEAYEFLDKIIRSSPNAIIATDMKGNIIIWNRAAEETLGYKAEEVIGKMNIEKIYPEGMAKEVMKKLRSPDYGGKGRLRSFPMVYMRRDGELIEGNLSAAIIYDSSGKEIASVGIFVDLKERLEMERKLRATQEQLLRSEKLAAMGRLTSQIAHELNNPLYGIMNTFELLKTEIPPESKRRKILDMAYSETIRLTELLRKMLSFSRPAEEEKGLVDLNAIIDEILLIVKKQLYENSIKVNTSFDGNLKKVNASKNQLRQVFLNMIANAKDAMPNGGTLTIKTLNKDDNVEIEISDTGVGIKQENLSRIFEAFFTTKDSVKDAGLGLSVCYGLIKEHGGEIKVKSQLGKGTTFTIILPAHKPNN